MVPLAFVGEAKAVAEKQGLLMEIVHEVEVEALPDDLPEKVEVNVENLAAVGDQITVGDIKAPTGSEILTDPHQTIVKIAELTVAEPEPEAPAEEEATEEGTEATAEEGAGTSSEETKEEAPQETN